jgi:hypothetical protein
VELVEARAEEALGVGRDRDAARGQHGADGVRQVQLCLELPKAPWIRGRRVAPERIGRAETGRRRADRPRRDPVPH